MNDFKLLIKQIKNLKKEVSHFNIGKTELNNNIVCFVVGNNKSKNKIILQGGMHAREYITSFLLIKLIKYLKNFYFDACLYIIPLVNVDGVFICCGGLKSGQYFKTEQIFSKISSCNTKKNFKNLNVKLTKTQKLFKNKNKYGAKKLAKQKIETNKYNYSLIKCNAMGVDLNTNFNALWGMGKNNYKLGPNFENFVGFVPNSEKEVKALENLTTTLKPNLTLSYHSKGEVFYWGFENSLEFDKNYLNVEAKCVKIIKKTTGYKPIFTKNSCGGYKDWCINKLHIPSFTIEVGNDKLKHPIKRCKNLKSIFDKNKELVLNLIKEVF